jgi:nucleotide-binding universal stress UspA family protein
VHHAAFCTIEDSQTYVARSGRTLSRRFRTKEEIVFKHILFPTDGSSASLVAAEQCMRFAAQVGARVTAMHVVLPLHLFTYEPMAIEEARAVYRRNRDERGRATLAPVEQLARDAKVAFDSVLAEADEPYAAIMATAHERSCDLVAMASHGHKGIKGVLLGSQTQKLLTHSALPVLVFR